MSEVVGSRGVLGRLILWSIFCSSLLALVAIDGCVPSPLKDSSILLLCQGQVGGSVGWIGGSGRVVCWWSVMVLWRLIVIVCLLRCPFRSYVLRDLWGVYPPSDPCLVPSLIL